MIISRKLHSTRSSVSTSIVAIGSHLLSFESKVGVSNTYHKSCYLSLIEAYHTSKLCNKMGMDN